MKSTKLAEQVDEYVDIGDEMPTATYQSMEIEKDAEVASGSGGSGSGSSSSSGNQATYLYFKRKPNFFMNRVFT